MLMRDAEGGWLNKSSRESNRTFSDSVESQLISKLKEGLNVQQY